MVKKMKEPLDETKIPQVETILAYHFRDPGLLIQALTHSSYSKEMKQKAIEWAVEGGWGRAASSSGAAQASVIWAPGPQCRVTAGTARPLEQHAHARD